MVASSNFGNVFSMLAAAAWLPFTWMMSIQLLAQNLLYDISQIAIPWDSVDPEYLKTPKSWKTWGILTRAFCDHAFAVVTSVTVRVVALHYISRTKPVSCQLSVLAFWVDRSSSLRRRLVVLGPTSSVIDILTFALNWFYYGVKTADNEEAVRLTQTHWFLQG
ncbi:hypothetical protein E4U34_000343 [Claviceps purpurea]|nr:hypothetical protein E4U34_000343 [Claviceps purpurea]